MGLLKQLKSFLKNVSKEDKKNILKSLRGQDELWRILKLAENVGFLVSYKGTLLKTK